MLSSPMVPPPSTSGEVEELAKRLEKHGVQHLEPKPSWFINEHDELDHTVEYIPTKFVRNADCIEAAAQLRAQAAQVAELRRKFDMWKSIAEGQEHYKLQFYDRAIAAEAQVAALTAGRDGPSVLRTNWQIEYLHERDRTIALTAQVAKLQGERDEAVGILRKIADWRGYRIDLPDRTQEQRDEVNYEIGANEMLVTLQAFGAPFLGSLSKRTA